MIKFKEFAKKWYNNTLLMFALVVLAFSLAGYAANPGANVMFSSQIIELFFFSCAASLGIGISSFVRNNSVIKQALRFVLVYAAFAVFFFAFGAGNSFINNESGNKVFTVICLTLMFVGVYVVSASLIYGFFAITKAIQNKNIEYTNQFEDVKNKTEN